MNIQEHIEFKIKSHRSEIALQARNLGEQLVKFSEQVGRLERPLRPSDNPLVSGGPASVINISANVVECNTLEHLLSDYLSIQPITLRDDLTEEEVREFKAALAKSSTQPLIVR